MDYHEKKRKKEAREGHERAAKEKKLHGYQGHLRRRGLHAETSQVRAIHPADGPALQKGPRHASRTQSHLPAADHRRQEEPLLAQLHLPRRHHKRHHHRSQRFRAGTRYAGGKSHLGQVRPSYQSSRERRMHQRRFVGLTDSLGRSERGWLPFTNILTLPVLSRSVRGSSFFLFFSGEKKKKKKKKKKK